MTQLSYRCFVVCFIASVLVCSCLCAQESPKFEWTDQEIILGAWSVTHVEREGERTPYRQKWIFQKDTLNWYSPGRSNLLKYKLNPETNPKQIDAEVIGGNFGSAPNGTKFLGIYKFTGNKLVVCFGKGTDRPKEFLNSKNGVTYLLERASSSALKEKNLKPAQKRAKSWTGEPSIKSFFGGGGKLCTFKYLPKSSDVVGVEIHPSINKTKTPLTLANIAGMIDGMTPVKANDPKIRHWHYAPWHECEIETQFGEFRMTTYLGGLALIRAPDGSIGLVRFEHPK